MQIWIEALQVTSNYLAEQWLISSQNGNGRRTEERLRGIEDSIGICTEILSRVKDKRLIYCNHLYGDSNEHLSKCKNNK